jgi:uncharacterized protein YciU (UPF0263 family)
VSFEDTAARMREIRWGSAPDWDDRARDWLWAYYRRLGAYWPDVDVRTAPASPAIAARVQAALSPDDAARVASAVATIRAAADARRERLESTTRELLPMVLGWAVAVDAGARDAATDPGEPLLALFEAGFQLQHRHEGIHIHHESGWRIYQPPTRDSLAMRKEAEPSARRRGSARVGCRMAADPKMIEAWVDTLAESAETDLSTVVVFLGFEGALDTRGGHSTLTPAPGGTRSVTFDVDDDTFQAMHVALATRVTRAALDAVLGAPTGSGDTVTYRRGTVEARATFADDALVTLTLRRA